jgi:hypothetical protein
MTGKRQYALGLLLLFAVALWSQDLLYERTDGRSLTIDSLPDSRMTLLLFYDPECSDCQQELFVMRHSSQLRQAIAEARLQVLAVCTEPNDSLWRHTVEEMPSTWMPVMLRSDNWFDSPYDLSSLPAMYLLGRNRKILLKETDLYQVLELLRKTE